MASNNYEVHHDRKLMPMQKRGVLELNSEDALLDQNKLLTQQLDALTKQIFKIPQLQSVQATQFGTQKVLSCALYGGGHPSGQCFMLGGSLEEFNYMGNQNRQGNYGNPPYNNIFNLWWRNNNLGWKQDVGPSNRPLPYGY